MTAFVRGVTHSANDFGERHHVSASMSAKTGVAPTYEMGAAEAIHVASGTTTSSPGPTPSAISARWIADVQEGSAMANRTSRCRANAVSKRSWYMFASAYQAFVTASV